MEKGWIKLHRKILENPILRKPNYRALFVDILLRASFNETKVMFKGEIIKLAAGQFTTGTYVLAESAGIKRGTVYDILKRFQKVGLIQIQTDNKCSLITINNWVSFQETQQQTNNKPITTQKQTNTKEEGKEREEGKEGIGEKNSPTPKQITQEFFDSVETGSEQYLGLVNFFVEKTKAPEKIIINEIEKFHSYWTEPNHTGKKQLWQMKKTFDVKRRLVTWLNNSNKFSGYEKPDWKREQDASLEHAYKEMGIT